MPQTNISFMETAPPRTSEQWREIWLKKFEQACLEKELKESTVNGFRRSLDSVDLLPRMKTGKSLPKVYSAQEIEAQILKQYLTSNPKLVYLFKGQTPGLPYPKRTIEKIYDNACQASGIPGKAAFIPYAILLQPIYLNKVRDCVKSRKSWVIPV
jgi:hypothetical protein